MVCKKRKRDEGHVFRYYLGRIRSYDEETLTVTKALWH